jgi:prenyltransferase beta subunit
MLQVARLAPRQLGEAAPLVAEFVRTQRHPSGGFCDRAGAPDPYYTVFGAECLVALGFPPPDLGDYLRGFGDGAGLDFVHQCCLARCWADIGGRAPESLLDRVARPQDTAYWSMLAYGACQDLGRDFPDPAALLATLDSLRSEDGAYGNWPGMEQGQTSATAAAITLRRQLDAEPEPALADWLMRQWNPQGGFAAAPGVPMPDLLSTATALHALVGMQVPLDPVREAGLDFIDTLWTNRGGFFGSWADDAIDCEYTYYALLALGHLSV